VGAGAIAVGADVVAVGADVVAGAVAVADWQGVAVAEVAGAGIVVEDPAGAAAADVTVAVGDGAAEALLSAPANIAPAASGDGAAG